MAPVWSTIGAATQVMPGSFSAWSKATPRARMSARCRMRVASSVIVRGVWRAGRAAGGLRLAARAAGGR
ncbi:hypothetical protein ABG088_00275, partial [Hydrogenibacillus schlegelii]